jgi:hypothetical protein
MAIVKKRKKRKVQPVLYQQALDHKVQKGSFVVRLSKEVTDPPSLLYKIEGITIEGSKVTIPDGRACADNGSITFQNSQKAYFSLYFWQIKKVCDNKGKLLWKNLDPVKN